MYLSESYLFRGRSHELCCNHPGLEIVVRVFELKTDVYDALSDFSLFLINPGQMILTKETAFAVAASLTSGAVTGLVSVLPK